MAESPEPKTKWWLEPKAAGIEAKRRAKATKAQVNPGDAFLIVTEGKVTELFYFKLLRSMLRLNVVQIRVQPGGSSDPLNVIETAAREAQKHQQLFKKGRLGINAPAKFDHVWAVVDTDVAVRNGLWNAVRHLANAKKVKLAPSTPCIEFWLLLHLGFTTRTDLTNGAAAKKALKVTIRHVLDLDYSTNAETAGKAITKLIERWPEAARHADQVRRHHQTAATPPPANPSTDVDLLVRALNDSAQPHNRKLNP